MRYAPNPDPDGWKTTTAIAKVTTMTMDAWKNCTMMESGQKPQKCIMVAVVNAHRKRRRMLQNAVEAMITFMEERDVTDVAFEAEFMTSRSEYNETLDISFASHRAHGE
jgi:hypothetical protein